MSHRITVAIALTSLVMNVAGCTGGRNVKFFADEIPKNLLTEIESVQLCSDVRRIILRNRDVISISDEGVQVDALARALIATGVDGEPVEIDMGDVWAVQSGPGHVVVFDDSRGRIDMQEEVIRGKRPDSTEVIVALSDVCYVTGQCKSSTSSIILRNYLLFTAIVVTMSAFISQSFSSH